MSNLVGLIPAAGKGVRARPYTKLIPKGMLDINGIPNIQRIIAIMRDEIGIQDIYIVIGFSGEIIKKYFDEGSRYGVNITYIENNELEKGLAYSILLAREYIKDYFCVMFADECYINSNHRELSSFPYRDGLATCAIMHTDDRDLIQQNYSVEIDGKRVVKLVEKPKKVINDILGCGTLIFSPEIFLLLERAFVREHMKYVEFMTFIDELCQNGENVLYFNLTGTYVNINDRDSLNLAKYYERRKYFEQSITTLLIYSEGDEENIAFTIKRFKELELIHNIYVILPDTNTIEKDVISCGVSMIKCPPEIQLYGEKLKYAMENAPGDILILCEGDYSFPDRDVLKLLTYMREADMVVGTRTTRQLIDQGNTMRGIVRFANVLLAKLLEVLWWSFEGRFTDVGCTFRAIWKSAFSDVKNRLVSRGPEFSAEMMIEVLSDRKKVIEIPVNYFNRSQSMYRKYQNINTFYRFFMLICRKKFKTFLRQGTRYETK